VITKFIGNYIFGIVIFAQKGIIVNDIRNRKMKADIQKLNFLNEHKKHVDVMIVEKINQKVVSEIYHEFCEYFRICPICGAVKVSYDTETRWDDICPDMECSWNKQLAEKKSRIAMNQTCGH
jgi:hypothetical protein